MAGVQPVTSMCWRSRNTSSGIKRVSGGCCMRPSCRSPRPWRTTTGTPSRIWSVPRSSLAHDTGWLDRAENLLLFGPSGVGKTHLAAGICRSLIALDRSARFYSATTLVQELQRAKADYALAKALNRLDRYALVVIDDIGYVRKDEAETSVLFELVMHRYERRSLLVTSNQPFSEWENVFSTSAMTVAAVDRLVDHSTIIQINGESYRRKRARRLAS